MPQKKSRRGQGEGTIYQRSDGYWIGQITVGRDEEGRQQRKTISAKTEKELIAKMKKYQYQQMQGELPKNNTMSLSDWMESWLTNYKKPKVRQTTYENYENLYNKHIKDSYIGKTQVQKVTTHQIQSFMNTKAETLSPRTVNLLHFLIQNALEQAKKNNIVNSNVANNCELHKNEKKEVRPLTADEVLQLLKTIQTHRLFAALMLELNTGIRRGELQALKWSNIDLDNGTITVAENLVRVRGGIKIHKPKTKSSSRTIYLPEKVVAYLKAHKERQDAEKATYKDTYQDEGFVFCQMKTGKPINPRNFQRMFDGWLVRAGLPKKTRFHDLSNPHINKIRTFLPKETICTNPC